jgi:hypothetical protein
MEQHWHTQLFGLLLLLWHQFGAWLSLGCAAATQTQHQQQQQLGAVAGPAAVS